MKSIYEEGEYLKNNPDWHVADSPWKADFIHSILNKNKIQANSICEVGCGAGEILVQLSKKMPTTKYSGYEFSPQAFAESKKRAAQNISYYNEDVFSDKENHFDVVMAIDVFEHVEDYFGFLTKMKGKGTYKIYHIPLDLSVNSMMRPSSILHAREKVGHIHFFSKEIAFSSLADTGHEIIDWCFTARSLDLKAETLKTRLAKLPRKIAYLISPKLAARYLGGFSLLVLTK
jgi:cyclopropane fatty-acyl-phospholipid synthase-like methyltransferase